MVLMTQTLLLAFGARVVTPSTGLLLYNGFMWFAPYPDVRTLWHPEGAA